MNSKIIGWLRTVALAAALLICEAGRGDTITVSAAISLKEALLQMAPEFESGGSDKLDINFGASGTLAAQIKQGAPVDLFISAAQKQVNDLIASGLADGASRTPVTGNRLVLIVGGDFKNPPGQFRDLTDSRFVHIAIGEPKVVPAGDYAMQTLRSLGLAQVLEPKLVKGENVRQVLSYVMRGEAEAGIVYASDAQEAGGAVRVAAMAAESSHDPIVYPAVIITSGNRAAARRFLDFLKTDKAAAILAAHGFTPPPAPMPTTRP